MPQVEPLLEIRLLRGNSEAYQLLIVRGPSEQGAGQVNVNGKGKGSLKSHRVQPKGLIVVMLV